MDNCPKCNTNWVGDEIPEDIVSSCAGTHWKREIGIDGGFLGIYDGIVAVQCPDCKETMPRNNSSWALEMYNYYKKITPNG